LPIATELHHRQLAATTKISTSFCSIYFMKSTLPVCSWFLMKLKQKLSKEAFIVL
jgi:hypothetical protein